jgi:polysaccharide biosynthesis protein PslL
LSSGKINVMLKGRDSRRIVYLDIAKGIGILLVVMAHNDLAAVSLFLYRFIYSFHMPLFFFLSGYFLNTSAPFLNFLWKRFNTILKPYLFTILLIYITSVSFSNMSFKTALGRMGKAMYASGLYIDWVQLWFLPSLFVTSLFAYLLHRLLLRRFNNRWVRLSILLSVAAIGAYFLDAFYPFSLSLPRKQYELFGLPYSVDLVLLTGFYYLLGNEIRQINLTDLLNKIWFVLGTGGVLLLLITLFPQTIDFNTRLFPIFPINTIKAILGILFTLAVSKQIELRTSSLSSLLEYIGQASLFILIFHVPIQEFWNAKILHTSNSQPLATVLAFLISVGLSLAFYKVFVEQNPIALYFFGRRSSPREKKEQAVPNNKP